LKILSQLREPSKRLLATHDLGPRYAGIMSLRKEIRVRAHNSDTESENRIHDDRVAATYGFRGGLVPGVTVYGYMTAPVMEGLGPVWMERGGIAVRFLAPFYEGDVVVIRPGEGDPLEIRAEREDGTLCATATATLDPKGPAFLEYPAHRLPPPENRPVASTATIHSNTPLGAIVEMMQVDDVYGRSECLLRMANRILMRNFQMSPWIHAASELRHCSMPQPGDQIAVHGLIEECFERKGRHFAVAALAMSAEGRSIASVRHTFIFSLNQIS